jgi:hypothetical protein
MGAQVRDLELFVRQIFNAEATVSHPDSFQRIDALIKGWVEAGGKGVSFEMKKQLQQAIARLRADDAKW